MLRLLRRLFNRTPSYDTPSYLPNLLSPCALASNRPHFYGRVQNRGTRCLRCGHERAGK